MRTNFRMGEVVRLKRDGTKMTVSGNSESPVVECTWFDKDNKLHKDLLDVQHITPEFMSFSDAFNFLKQGKKIARMGWNGKSMWIALSGTQLRSLEVKSEDLWSPHSKEFAEQNGGSVEVPPYVIMKTADNKIQAGWLPSQPDLFAEDWEVLD